MRQGDSFLSMLVDLEQWRSAIGALGLSLPYKMCRKVIRGAGFVPSLLSLIELYLFCCLLVFISVPMLPVAVALYILVAQFVHSEKFCFLHIYAYLYFHIRFLIHCCLGKITKLPGLVSTFFLQHNHLIVQYANFYGCAYVLCQTCHLLHLQWFFLNSILLSGDVELNPGPNTSMFSFCSWNLNSITAHDFVRVSLIEAYNSIYDYDLLGIVETHIDSFVDETK